MGALEDISGVQSARDAGYSDDEIYTHLAGRPGFAEAKKAGYSFDEVYQHMYSKAQQQAKGMQEEAFGIGSPVGSTLAMLRGDLKVDPLSKDMHEFLDEHVPAGLEKQMVDTINTHAQEEWERELGPHMVNQLKQHYAAREKGISDLDEPIYYLPKPGGEGATASLVRGAEQSAEGLVTLKNIGLLGATILLPKPLQKVIGAGFLAMMTKGAAEEASTAFDPTKTSSERLEATGRGLTTAALAGLGLKSEFGRPSEGGVLPPSGRPAGLTQEQADAATTRNQLRALAPETAAVVEPKPKGDPETLDSLTLARRKLTEGFASAKPEQQKVRQLIIDHIDDALLKHDKDAVNESAARTAQPAPRTEPPTPSTKEEVQPSPPQELSELDRIKQELRSRGATQTAAALGEVPPPAQEPPTTSSSELPTPQEIQKEANPHIAQLRQALDEEQMLKEFGGTKEQLEAARQKRIAAEDNLRKRFGTDAESQLQATTADRLRAGTHKWVPGEGLVKVETPASEPPTVEPPASGQPEPPIAGEERPPADEAAPVTEGAAVKPEPGTRIKGPALIGEDGKPLIVGEIGETHQQLKDKLIADAKARGDDKAEAAAITSEHGFVDDKDNVHDRFSGFDLAESAKQIPDETVKAAKAFAASAGEKVKPELHSDQLVREAPAEVAPSLHREASAADVLSYIDPNSHADSPFGPKEIHVATSKEMALGQQGGSSGIRVEIDPSGLEVKNPRTKKPGSEFYESIGENKEKVILAQPSELSGKIRSVEFPKKSKMDAFEKRLKNFLEHSWDKKETGGSITYTPKTEKVSTPLEPVETVKTQEVLPEIASSESTKAPEEKRITEAPPDIHEQFNSEQDKLSELQAEHDFQIEEGTPKEELAGLRNTIAKQRKKVAVLKEQRDQSLLQATDAPHTAPVADARNPEIAKDISPQALGIAPKMPPFLEKLTDVMAGVAEHPQFKDFTAAFKGWLGGMAGKTFPRLTALNREVGELGARWISSRIAAKPSAMLFASKVLEGTGVDAAKFGAALTEDNLRSVRKGFEDAGNTEAAADVNTIIGGKGSPFKTEADYQAFLAEPATQQAIARHKAMWEQDVDPMYKRAMSIDPDEPLPARGLQTGARINLNPLREDEPVKDKVFTVGRGNLLGTLRKKSAFGIQAKGTGTGYGMNYLDMMSNTFGKQLEIANKNRFEDALVKAGLAKIESAGQPVEINGREAKSYPYKRQSILTKEGQSIPVNRNIYIDPRIAGEYEIGANVQKNPFAQKSATGLLSVVGRLNTAALAGLTDASVHVANLASALFTRPGGSGGLVADSLLSALGRVDVPVTVIKAVVKGFRNNEAQFKELAEIGAMRAPHEPSSVPGLRQTGQLIQWADKTTRLVLDDAFKRMVKEGLVENTETNRREFVNQVGQYNKRAQGPFTRFARDSGLAPFVTAGKTFNALGVKTATLSPGVKAASLPAAAALRANVLVKWVGASVLVGAFNYMITGNANGRAGVPIGAIDTGKTDANGRPLYIPVFALLGLGRALRVTGIRGVAEAKRGGLTNQDAFDSATRDIINSAIAPFAGPAVHFATTATGLSSAVGVGRQAPVVAPGESQRLSDLKEALLEANPIVASIIDANKPGGGTLEAMQRQLPRYLPQSGKPAEMMAKYPEIVRKAQARSFINDVVGHARKLDPEVRQKFLQDALARLSEEDRPQAEQVLKYSHLGYFPPERPKTKKRR